jgi:2-C-methyl-D-erythritol 4-phosphate cytidylyltransferase
MKKVSAIVVAAGSGRRFGSAKQFALLGGKPVLDWALQAFAGHPEVDGVVLVLPAGQSGTRYRERWSKIVAVVEGGERRQDSVAAGFAGLEPGLGSLVLVHDGVRPLVGPEVIGRVIAKAKKTGAAVAAIPVEDTIKEAAGGFVVRTLERDTLRRIQTPQGFRYEVLGEALRRAREDGFYGTDEAALVERTGHPVALVMGDPRNIKITTAADLKIAEAWIED